MWKLKGSFNSLLISFMKGLLCLYNTYQSVCKVCVYEHTYIRACVMHVQYYACKYIRIQYEDQYTYMYICLHVHWFIHVLRDNKIVINIHIKLYVQKYSRMLWTFQYKTIVLAVCTCTHSVENRTFQCKQCLFRLNLLNFLRVLKTTFSIWINTCIIIYIRTTCRAVSLSCHFVMLNRIWYVIYWSIHTNTEAK